MTLLKGMMISLLINLEAVKSCSKNMISELETLVGSNSQIVNWENIPSNWKEKILRTVNSNDFSTYLIYPHTQKALSQVIKYASDRRLNLIPCGSGSKLSWGGLTKDISLLVSTKYLNRIIEHAVDDLTVTVESGISLTELQDTLKQTGQFLALDPSYPEDATIGGIIATADSGSLRTRYGGVRDMLLGLSFVRADGQIAKAGGRVVKNVAGYDLMKLFTGSYGTLGVICQATFRLYPLPEASTTAVLTGENEAIATATKTLLASTLTPTAADLLSASVVDRLQIGGSMGLIVRFQSISESVKEQITILESIAKQVGLQTSLYEDADEEQLWQRLQEIMRSRSASSETRSPASIEKITCKIGVLPNAAVETLNVLDGLGIIRASSGLGQLNLENSEEAIDIIKKMRSHCEHNRGFLTILEAPVTIKKQLDPWGYTGNALEIMRKIKKQFDPENILSPDRFVGGI